MRRTATLLALPALLVCGALPAWAAPTPDDVTHLSPFFEALAALEDGSATDHARITWWGDSAIVTDGYTGEVRTRLAKRFGYGGPGFILMAPTWDGYLHTDVRLKRHDWETKSVLHGNLKSGRYGLGGVMVHSFGGASSTFKTKKGKPTFDRVHVYYRGNDNTGLIQLFLNGAGSATATHNTERKAGDHDEVWTYDAEKSDEVRVRAGGKGIVRVYGVALETRAPGVVVDTLGVLGMRARRLRNVDGDHLAEQVKARDPRLLVVNFGGNERVDGDLSVDKHAAEIGEVVAMVKKGAPKAACLVMGPIAHGERKGGKLVVDPALMTIYEAQKRAAGKHGCAFLDTLALMGGEQAAEKARKKGWLGGDLAHLNGKGHRAVGELISTWLTTGYDQWKSQQASAAPANEAAATP